MNLGRIRGLVYEHLGLPTTHGKLTPAVVNGNINRALQAYSGEGSWPWLDAKETITSAANTEAYTPAVDWNRTTELRDAVQGNVLNFASQTQLDDQWTPDWTARPTDFCVYGDQLILRPIPDGIYTFTHRYERNEKYLIADSDTPYLPDQYVEVVVEYACHLCYRQIRETERFQEALNSYNAWVVKLRARAIRRADLPLVPRQRPGGFL